MASPEEEEPPSPISSSMLQHDEEAGDAAEERMRWRLEQKKMLNIGETLAEERSLSSSEDKESNSLSLSFFRSPRESIIEVHFSANPLCN
jgi:hypothetical protein